MLLDPVCTTDPESGALVLSSQSQLDIILLGSLEHRGVCGALKRDGKPCSMLVDSCVSERCLYHRFSNVKRNVDTPSVPKTLPQNHSVVRSATPSTTSAKPALSTEVGAVDILDMALHAPKRSSQKTESGKTAHIHVNECDETTNSHFITLEDSSDEDLITERNVRREMAAGESGVNDRIEQSRVESRRDGAVKVPVQSSVFGSMSSRNVDNNMYQKLQISRTNCPPGGAELKGSNIGNRLRQPPERRSEIVSAGESLLLNKTNLYTNAELLNPKRIDAKRKAEVEAKQEAQIRKQKIDDLLTR